MSGYDKASELKSFDETKAGVKGLVDNGITHIPRFFIQPPDDLPTATTDIPVIDLHAAETDPARRQALVAEVRQAAETLGFFQVVNHGIPLAVLDEMLEGVRRFNEQPIEAKREFYTREQTRKIKFNSNFDLYTAPAANWRDTLFCLMEPEPPAPEELPLACRDITFEYSNHIRKLGIHLLEILSEALGLDRDHLTEMECAKGSALVAHYYPPCPEPHLTLSTGRHSDPDFLTILLQDQVGGLQVLCQEKWINVAPLPGALIVNIGDLLQLVSNDKLRSVEHRVLARSGGSRVSVACFFTMFRYPSSRIYGPIKELLSDEDPPLYREILLRDFDKHYASKGLDGRSALSYFRL